MLNIPEKETLLLSLRVLNAEKCNFEPPSASDKMTFIFQRRCTKRRYWCEMNATYRILTYRWDFGFEVGRYVYVAYREDAA